MPAWKTTQKWTPKLYQEYRKYAAIEAPKARGRTEDCADLSMKFLIYFAEKQGLTVTFEDNDNVGYVSKADHPVWASSQKKAWSNRDEFYDVVKQKIGVEALWKHSTERNDAGPEPGDLMIRYGDGYHHAALIFAVYNAGVRHPQQQNRKIPNFPGPRAAEWDQDGTEYFKGTVDDDGITQSRDPDYWPHLDYLNHRGTSKTKAELIYFANSWQQLHEHFEYRRYSWRVLNDWEDWDGTGFGPPVKPLPRGYLKQRW